ncbi:hypothetical protein HPP92_011224 [Vanilla planifolia]|uniref:Uncharacterized protein n=1 Tax=Vanilla planifolia TaxID=51239 RepID=A0A835R0G0_VANPL|nr:hypothetical protein HPP92_011492 [Vanilla planifolia]KAG0483140.1 hypothetical protein HPP92_011224 [Vanilla planifolia]
MPRVELDSVLCGGEGKIACETVSTGAGPALPEEDPNMPAESFQVRIGEDIDWIDFHALYDREDSTKGSTNPKSHHTKNTQQHPPSSSQRFSGNMKSKVPIIALPNKVRHPSLLSHSARRQASGRIFPKKKSASDGKSAGAVPEPGSPQVSCFGKVLSNRERERNQRRGGASAEGKVDIGKRSAGGRFWGGLAALLLCGRPAKREFVEEDMRHGLSKVRDIKGRSSSSAEEQQNAVVPPMGLEAMKRFSSVRRSLSWGREEDGDFDRFVSRSEPLERDGMPDHRRL